MSVVKGFLIVAAIGMILFGVVKCSEWQDNTTEADSSCYDDAKLVASDKSVQLVMSDGFLSLHECREVQRIKEKADRQYRIDEFMNAARAANAQGQ